MPFLVLISPLATDTRVAQFPGRWDAGKRFAAMSRTRRASGTWSARQQSVGLMHVTP